MNTFNVNRKAKKAVKVDQEPNPFEQSFSSSAKFNPFPPKMIHGVDTWVSDISAYSYDTQSINNDSYSSLSDPHATTSEDSDDTPPQMMFNGQQQQQQPLQLQYTSSSSSSSNDVKKSSTKKRHRTVKVPEDEEKRKNFLERNRIAALKCRQRKKQWLSNLQNRVEYLTNDNDQLMMEANALRKEIMDLKTLLVAHKDCPQYNNSAKVTNYAMQQPVYHHHPSFTAIRH